MWTAQEYVMAKAMTIHRGRCVLDRRVLNEFMEYMPRHIVNGCCKLRKEHTVIMRDKHGTLFDQWRAHFGPIHSDTSILLPLEYYRGREAGVVLDKVYGLLGLSGDAYRRLISVNYHVAVEVRLPGRYMQGSRCTFIYAMLFQDLFTSVIKVESEVSERLNFLSYCGNRLLDVPSWVPDWTTNNLTSTQWRGSRCGGLMLSRYNADKYRRPPGSFFIDGRKLMTFGIRVGTIYRRTVPLPGPLERKYIRNLWRFITWERPEKAWYSPTQDLETAFWLTMCGDLNAFSQDKEDLYFERLDPAEHASSIDIWKKSANYDRSKSAETGHNDELDENFASIDAIFTDVTMDRCFIETDSGSIGFASDRSECGDVIVVLSGGSLAYVLRPLGGSGWEREYMYVGDAYIHGVMDGEAFDWVQEGSHIIEVFPLV